MGPLVVEEADVLLHENDAQLFGGLVDGRVVLAASRRSNVLGARADCTVDVVDEGELLIKLESASREAYCCAGVYHLQRHHC